MTITTRMVSDVSILDLTGKITLGDSVESLGQAVSHLLAAGSRTIVLNLEGVPYIDSAGLGELVRIHTTVSRQGGSLKLLNLTTRIEDLLVITKLLTVFDTYDAEADAVTSASA